MAGQIGYNDGILGLVGWVRKISLGTVKFRPLADRPANHSQWSWLENLERTLRILKDEHDAAVGPVTPPVPPPPPPPPPQHPWDSGLAPQAYNQGSRGQNAKYNIRINCTRQPDGSYRDARFAYEDNGLCKGGRSEAPIPELKPSDMSDGLEPWEAYVWNGVQIGPNKENYPARSYDV